MVTSIDGRVTGDFLYKDEARLPTEVYYQINREYRKNGAGGFICGRITMEQSFTGGYYPDLSKYEPINDTGSSFFPEKEKLSGFYAISFDPRGRLGWTAPYISDSDWGYDRAQVIEVLTEEADKRYLSYLRSLEIPYVIAGRDKIDVSLALGMLYEKLNTGCLILEGGSIINGHFLLADCVDELSLVEAPLIASKGDKPLFSFASVTGFSLVKSEEIDGVIVKKYKKAGK